MNPRFGSVENDDHAKSRHAFAVRYTCRAGVCMDLVVVRYSAMLMRHHLSSQQTCMIATHRDRNTH